MERAAWVGGVVLTECLVDSESASPPPGLGSDNEATRDLSQATTNHTIAPTNFLKMDYGRLDRNFLNLVGLFRPI